MPSAIYRIINPINHMTYIGQTFADSPAKRAADHVIDGYGLMNYQYRDKKSNGGDGTFGRISNQESSELKADLAMLGGSSFIYEANTDSAGAFGLSSLWEGFQRVWGNSHGHATRAVRADFAEAYYIATSTVPLYNKQGGAQHSFIYKIQNLYDVLEEWLDFNKTDVENLYKKVGTYSVSTSIAFSVSGGQSDALKAFEKLFTPEAAVLGRLIQKKYTFSYPKFRSTTAQAIVNARTWRFPAVTRNTREMKAITIQVKKEELISFYKGTAFNKWVFDKCSHIPHSADVDLSYLNIGFELDEKSLNQACAVLAKNFQLQVKPIYHRNANHAYQLEGLKCMWVGPTSFTVPMPQIRITIRPDLNYQPQWWRNGAASDSMWTDCKKEVRDQVVQQGWIGLIASLPKSVAHGKPTGYRALKEFCSKNNIAWINNLSDEQFFDFYDKLQNLANTTSILSQNGNPNNINWGRGALVASKPVSNGWVRFAREAYKNDNPRNMTTGMEQPYYWAFNTRTSVSGDEYHPGYVDRIIIPISKFKAMQTADGQSLTLW